MAGWLDILSSLIAPNTQENEKKEETPQEKGALATIGEAVNINKQTLADIGKVLGGRNALTVEEESKEAKDENQTKTQVAAQVVGMGLYARFALCAENITDENNPYQARDAARENVNLALRDNNGMAYTA